MSCDLLSLNGFIVLFRKLEKMIDGVYVLLAIKYGFWKYAIFSLGPCEKFSFFGLFQPQNKCLQYASYKPTGNFFVAEFRLKTRVLTWQML